MWSGRIPQHGRFALAHLRISQGYQSTPRIISQFPLLPIGFNAVPVRHATHGVQGKANGPKDGAGKRLGAKKNSGTYVIPGNIIFRQRGTKWHPGENVGMGRDHTIYATDYGYVRYYRNPLVHPKRRYIGLVFSRKHHLPTPPDTPRRRRFGLEAVPRTPDPQPPAPEDDGGIAGRPGMTIREVAKRYNVTPEVVREARRRKAEGRVPLGDLHQMRNYGYRETNWQIGRAADRAGITVPQYDKRDRFAAWRAKVEYQKKNPKILIQRIRKKSQKKARQGRPQVRP